MNERPIPEAAQRDKNAVEMVRVWVAERGLHCSLKIGMYRETTSISEEKAWGIILADIARHVARALTADHDGDQSASLQRIQQSFLAELDAPTSEVSGSF